VVACPMCHANLDTRQDEIAAYLKRPFSLPILYFSQVVGYALGLEAAELGMLKHIVDPVPLMLARCRRRQVGEVVV
jgi:heterodisulfide reductase subunit B